MIFTGERFVPELHGQIAYEHRHRYRTALELARGRDILDIACGEGYGASLLAEVARSVIGVDIDADSIRHAAAHYPAMNLSFRTGSATAIPVAAGSIDLVVCFETLEHLTEQREMMAEFNRVLRADGRVIVSSPNKLVYSDARGTLNPYHVRELYFDEFRALLEESFPTFQTYGQRIFGASAIHPLVGDAEQTSWLGPGTHRSAGIVALPSAEYFIAVCAKHEGDTLLDLSSVYLDPNDDLLDDVRGGGLAAAPSPTNGHASATEIHLNGTASTQTDAEVAGVAGPKLQSAADEAAPDGSAARIVELEEQLLDVRLRLRRSAAVTREMAQELLELRGDAERYRASAFTLEANVLHALRSLERARALLDVLSAAHVRGSATIGELVNERDRYRRAVPALRSERAALADALSLREGQIAALESRLTAHLNEPLVVLASRCRTIAATLRTRRLAALPRAARRATRLTVGACTRRLRALLQR